MNITHHGLPAAMDNLERALEAGMADGPRVWAAQVDQALAEIERTADRQDAALELPGGGLVDIDRGQSPSPGMDRQVERLHDDVASLLGEVRGLRRRVRRLLEVGEPDGHRDLVSLYSRTAALLDEFARHEKEQTRLVLEIASTDIGAGD